MSTAGSRPQQQTLSIRISESLREFLHLSRQILTAGPTLLYASCRGGWHRKIMRLEFWTVLADKDTVENRAISGGTFVPVWHIVGAKSIFGWQT